MDLGFMMSNDNLSNLFIVIVFFKNIFLRLCLQEFLYLKSFLSHASPFRFTSGSHGWFQDQGPEFVLFCFVFVSNVAELIL